MTISRGDIWMVNLNPTIGAEIRKTRPTLVVSADAVGTLPIRLVAPLTEWNESFADKVWLVKIEPDETNGLSKKVSCGHTTTSRFGYVPVCK